MIRFTRERSDIPALLLIAGILTLLAGSSRSQSAIQPGPFATASRGYDFGDLAFTVPEISGEFTERMMH